MADQTAIVEYYVNRLIAQYVTKPKARATVGAYVREALIDGLYDELNNCFTLSTAVGPQLDILGRYVGLSRNIGVPEDPPYFGFQSSDSDTGNLNGFTDSTNAGVNAQAIFFQTDFLVVVNTALTDTSYRFMLVLKIALNQSNGTLANIQDFLHAYLDGFVALTDNADMTMTYTFSQKLPVGLNAETLAVYLPRPMGVGINVVTLGATLSPSSVTKTTTDPASPPPFRTTVITDTPIVVTITNGVAPYTYQWQQLTGSGSAISTLFVSSGQFANNAIFELHFTNHAPPNNAYVSTWQCLVSDSRGLTALSDIVTVHQNNNAAP